MIDDRFMYLSALLIAWGAYSYIQDVRRNSIQPNLVTWLLWTIAPLIAFAAQVGADVGPASFLTLMVGLCPLAVFITGLTKGSFRPTRFDILCGGASVIGLYLWQVTGSGVLAISMSIIADGLAALPTVKKAYLDPRSESPFLFLLFAISAAITLLTLNKLSLESAGFPLYILTLYVLLYCLTKFEPGLSKNSELALSQESE